MTRFFSSQAGLNQKTSWIDALGCLILISLFVCYSIFGSNFAELHISLAGLSFPIFIGEIAFAFLVFLSACKFLLKSKPQKNSLILPSMFFLLFILMKALYGYSVHGPLAFRNAALFYYVFYAFFAYYFYSETFFKDEWSKICLLIIFFSILKLYPVKSYFIFPYLAILFALAISLKNKFLRAAVFVILLIFFPYREMLNTSRSGVIAFVAGLLYLVFTIFSMLAQKTWKRVLLLLIFLSLLGVACYSLLPDPVRHRIEPLVTHVKDTAKVYHYLMKESDARLVNYHPINFPLMLYQDNQSVLGSGRVSVRTDSASSETKVFVQTGPKAVLDDFQPKDDLKSPVQPNFESQPPVEINKLVNMTGEQELHGLGTVVWRLLLWTDVLEDMKSEIVKQPFRVLTGVDFGKPIRSKRQEVLVMAFPESTGWHEPHNSFLCIVYRAGLIGAILIAIGLFFLSRSTHLLVIRRSISGLFLMSALVFWLTLSLTLVVLELPQYSIPFWTLAGFFAGFVTNKTDTA